MASELDKLQKVGIGTATTLSAPGKALAATSITVGSTANFPTTTGITFAIRVVDGNGELVAGTYTEWVGTVTSGTTLAMNAVPVYGSDQVYTAGSTTQVYMPLSSYSYNKHIDADLVHADQDGTLKAGAVDVTAVIADGIITRAKLATAVTTEMNTDWKPGLLPAVNSVTENGNRSADITFASTVASILTPGMRIRTSRTVAAPTYMGGAFNGTTHYFTKVTCTSTLSTVTDNFTLMGFANPTAYAQGTLAGRMDAAGANGLYLRQESDGRITVGIQNGGGANARTISTYQSVALNKKTHVTATWATGTVVIYLDGVSVPVATAVTSGTAPTTAGTGGDFSIGRLGAANAQYYTGYISGVGVFNAVLSAATIRSYKNQALTGSETNCIGAWSLNNTAVNQQAAGTNDLTATNSVGYTARSPYCTDANGVAAGTYDYAIVTAVATTVATVQYPEGCAIPTSGGISTVDYSGVKAPFGMPVDENRWTVESRYRTTNINNGASTSNTYYNVGSMKLTVPTGKYRIKASICVQATMGAATAHGASAAIGTSAGNSADVVASTSAYAASADVRGTSVLSAYIEPTTATAYYGNIAIIDQNATNLYLVLANQDVVLWAEPAYL